MRETGPTWAVEERIDDDSDDDDDDKTAATELKIFCFRFFDHEVPQNVFPQKDEYLQNLFFDTRTDRFRVTLVITIAQLYTGAPEPRGRCPRCPPALAARGQRGRRKMPFCDVR